MMTREEARRARPPIAFESLEGWLRRYALAHASMLMAREQGDEGVAAIHERRCAAWIVRLAERLSPARLSFELDEARRYGEREAEEWWEVVRRRSVA